MYIADFLNKRIRKVTVSTGDVSTVAGTGIPSFSGDGGAATSATMNCPIGIVVDTPGIYMHTYLSSFVYLNHLPLPGNLYIADTLNHRVRKVTVQASPRY